MPKDQENLLLVMQEVFTEAHREDSKVEMVMHLLTQRLEELYKEKVQIR
ncbi:hypothetical protein JOC78_001640 [Bacillus ectoiniformans]|nr:hypothetical protein [Bacillus ectoiniformans]MBM7648694.1 hypothetical protein [Bacillus ectoiniformans]